VLVRLIYVIFNFFLLQKVPISHWNRSIPQDKLCIFSMKYTFVGKPLGTSPHFEDGTQDKSDSREAQGHVNNILI
jgi:hypothetical protein